MGEGSVLDREPQRGREAESRAATILHRLTGSRGIMKVREGARNKNDRQRETKLSLFVKGKYMATHSGRNVKALHGSSLKTGTDVHRGSQEMTRLLVHEDLCIGSLQMRTSELRRGQIGRR